MARAAAMNRALVFALLLLASEATAADYRRHEGILFPDADATPGATHAVPLATLCKVAYTDTVRNNPDSQKRRIVESYHLAWKDRAGVEVDHFIPLGLGGTNDDRNLWPQPYRPRPGAREKDVLELFLRRAVCTGAVSLERAQHDIRADWWSAYQRMKAGGYP